MGVTFATLRALAAFDGVTSISAGDVFPVFDAHDNLQMWDFELALPRYRGLMTLPVSERHWAPTPFKSAKATPTQTNSMSDPRPQNTVQRCIGFARSMPERHIVQHPALLGAGDTLLRT